MSNNRIPLFSELSIQRVIGLALTFLTTRIAAENIIKDDLHGRGISYKLNQHEIDFPLITPEQKDLFALIVFLSICGMVGLLVTTSLCLHKVKATSLKRGKKNISQKPSTRNKKNKQSKTRSPAPLSKNVIESKLKLLKERHNSIIKQCKNLEETFNSVKTLHEQQVGNLPFKIKKSIKLDDKTVIDDLKSYINLAKPELDIVIKMVYELGNNPSQHSLKKCDCLLVKFGSSYGKAIHEYAPNFHKYKEQLDQYYIQLTELADKAKKERKNLLSKNKTSLPSLTNTKLCDPNPVNKENKAKESAPSTSTRKIKAIVKLENLPTPTSSTLYNAPPPDFNNPDWKKLPRKKLDDEFITIASHSSPIASSREQLDVKIHGKSLMLEESLHLHIDALKHIFTQGKHEDDEPEIQRHEILLHLIKICNNYTEQTNNLLQALRVSLVHPKIERNWYDDPSRLHDFLQSYLQKLQTESEEISTASTNALLFAIQQNSAVENAFNQGPSNSGIFSVKEKNKGSITLGDYTDQAYRDLIKSFLQKHITTIEEIREKLDHNPSSLKANQYCYAIQYLILIIVKKSKKLGEGFVDNLYQTQLAALRNITAHQDREYSVTEIKTFVDLNFNQFANNFRKKYSTMNMVIKTA